MNGSKKMSYRASVSLIFMLYSMTSLFAEEQKNNEAMPSIEFLEFLGEWETEDDEWIDPLEFESEEFGKLIETTTENEN